MSNKVTFEVRQIEAWHDGDDWYWNQSFDFGSYETEAKDERKAFTRYLKRKYGIIFKKNRTLIEYDGDCYTIIDRKSKEPLFAAICKYW